MLFASSPLAIVGFESGFGACGAEVLISRVASTLVDICEVIGVMRGLQAQFD